MSKVTVILPIKNAAHTLARAVQSIQGQASADWEMIAVDDGSSDGSVERMKEFIKGDHRIQLKINPTPGIANALNYGIAQANGKYIARMDADDFSHPDRLEKQSSYLDNHRNIGLVASRINFLGDRENHQGYAAYIDWTNELLDWNDIRANRFVESPFAHPSVMFRKSLVEPALGPYRSGDFPEDYELWLRWMSNGVEMAKLPDYLLDWYDPPERLSRNDPRYSPKAFYKIKAKYLARWLKSETHIERPIWIWGAGRITRSRTRFLLEQGVTFSGYIDIDPRKTGTQLQGILIVMPDDLDLNSKPIVISYVGNRGAREDIKQHLIEKGLKEELDFILAA